MKGKSSDYILLAAVSALSVSGILTIASVSASLSLEKFGNTYYFLKHQLLFGFLPGIILGFLAFRTKLDSLKKWSPIFLLINLILLAMVFLPKVGYSFGGASRWISLGNTTFQPSEFLKLTFILYLAAWIGNRRIEKGFSQTLIAFLIIISLISLLLILQPDIGTLGIIVLIAISTYFLAGTTLWHSILTISLGAGGLLCLVKLAHYRLNRFLVFLRPETDPMGIGYQMKQVLITIGSGGIFGLGLGMSRQKFGFLPGSLSDTIFAVFSEETGFIGSLFLILLFLIIFWRGFIISKHATDKFSKLTAFAISFWLTLQAFINIGAMLGLLPLTGIPLPFFSYGGSAIISELIGVGILLNISRNTS